MVKIHIYLMDAFKKIYKLPKIRCYIGTYDNRGDYGFSS